MICPDCNQEMITADGCTQETLIINGSDVRRCVESIFDDSETGRCHDCGRLNDGKHYHHYGCDAEKCPCCGGQLLMCECTVFTRRRVFQGEEFNFGCTDNWRIIMWVPHLVAILWYEIYKQSTSDGLLPIGRFFVLHSPDDDPEQIGLFRQDKEEYFLVKGTHILVD